MQVVGADWAGRCWVCVALDPSGIQVVSERTMEAVVASFRQAAAIAVDIPIGLPVDPPMRRADDEASRLVSRSTVFPTYPREVYERASHAEAVALCRERNWPGISRQSFGLWARMLEVEPYAGQVHEVHPEVSLWKLNGETRLTSSKHTWNGFFERRALLQSAGIALPDKLSESVRAVDVLDAAAAAWTAGRIARGEHSMLPADAGDREPTIIY